MSFILPIAADAQVTFTIPDGTANSRLPAAPTGFNCLLNISSNLPSQMANKSGAELIAFSTVFEGNFSGWVTLAPNDAIAVSGLTSCGAVFVANHNFSKVAAGHMSGDVQFVKRWCELLAEDTTINPHYMLFATGNSGGYNAGEVLKSYMKTWGMWAHPVRAPSVKNVGSVLLCRSAAGNMGVVHAQRDSSLVSP